MKQKTAVRIILCLVCGLSQAQMMVPSSEDLVKKTQDASPKALDFTDLFGQEKPSRSLFDDMNRQTDIKLAERFGTKEAAENAVDPKQYKIGPGDAFSFNTWGALETRIPLVVNPEGKLSVPSVGEIMVNGLCLAAARDTVLRRAKAYYEKSKITLTLERMRIFRLHIAGEVAYPGTYLSQGTFRVSEMIYEAGGFTDFARTRDVELRHPDGMSDTLDMALYEQKGRLDKDPFVQGGDVIFVPSLGLVVNRVTVEGDRDCAGTYAIGTNETLLELLQRIKALTKNTDFRKIMVFRATDQKGGETSFLPLESKDGNGFLLHDHDRIVLPSRYVYVRGSVQRPGAYPFALNLTAKDYAGMAGTTGNINGAKVYHAFDRKTAKGRRVIVGPGDVVDVPETWSQRFKDYLGIVSTVVSLVIAGKAVGL
jgi:protein involved in polysaccharide export with SLBB domain